MENPTADAYPPAQSEPTVPYPGYMEKQPLPQGDYPAQQAGYPGQQQGTGELGKMAMLLARYALHSYRLLASYSWPGRWRHCYSSAQLTPTRGGRLM